VVISTENYSFAQLDEEAAGRRDQRSFHTFAEGQHSDVRGQIFNLEEGGELALPTIDGRITCSSWSGSRDPSALKSKVALSRWVPILSWSSCRGPHVSSRRGPPR